MQGMRAIVKALVNNSVANICAIRYLKGLDVETAVALDTGSFQEKKRKKRKFYVCLCL